MTLTNEDTMKKQIVSSWDLNIRDHFGDSKTCPNCDFEQEYDEWAKLATKLVLDTVGGKHGSVVVIMECPKCFGSIWVHVPIPFSEYDDAYPKEWVAATVKEDDKRRLIALREWAKGLCGNCKHLGGGNISTTAYMNCTYGCGPVELEECKKFEHVDDKS